MTPGGYRVHVTVIASRFDAPANLPGDKTINPQSGDGPDLTAVWDFAVLDGAYRFAYYFDKSYLVIICWIFCFFVLLASTPLCDCDPISTTQIANKHGARFFQGQHRKPIPLSRDLDIG